ncbi:BTAD domain-containing putative transcriptional regulator [Kitasatospora sp. McL0602]|uniref:AfsR/SARP family transcriptional regulator n=1 Tax=Kitasatospora sp. McL0602 TaxID=3439530 RepID=UPI003F8CB32B
MRFGVLGPVEIRDDKGERPVRGAKGRALLAALLCRPNQPISLGFLHQALWGHAPPPTAAASLQNHVGRLRRALGEEGEHRLRATACGYVLKVHDGELDSQNFAVLLEAARTARATEDWQNVSLRTASALRLWRGEPLADLPDAIALRAEVEHLSQGRLQAVEWHFEAELHQGRHGELAPDLSRWIARYPFHEGLHACLITALYRGGREAEALRACEDVRVRLGEELGAAPGALLSELHQRVLAGDPALRWQAEEGPPRRRASSEVRGRSAAVAEHRPAQLPHDIQDFTGRRREVGRLAELLATSVEGAPQVVVITGMGGVGKTVLAVHVAQRVRHLFPDGQLFANLHGYSDSCPRDPHDLLPVFLASLSGETGPATGRSLPEHPDDRATSLRSALDGRRVLMVLDNARDARQVLSLLPGTSGCAVIVTSRRTLTDLSAGEQMPLAPLDRTDQHALLEVFCGRDRVQQDQDGARELLIACGGLPLAMRIAAVRLATRPTWTLTTMARQFRVGSGRLRALATGRLDLETAFSSSYQVLRESEQQTEQGAARAFRLLALLPDERFGVGQVAALLDCQPGRALELLEILVDVHLVESPAALSYQLHSLLREYAVGRLMAEERPELLDLARLRLVVAGERERTGAGGVRSHRAPVVAGG